MSTRVLVTGASGQIGSELIPFLRARYGPDSTVATAFPPESAKSLPWHADVLDVLDYKALRESLQRSEVDQIYHLGGILSATGERDPDLAWRVNVQGLKNVLDAARELRIHRVFWPSSIAVFGPDVHKAEAPQRTALNPTTIYGITKVTGELLCGYYSHKYGLDTRCLRYPGIISSETLPGGGTTDYAVGMFYAALRGEVFNCFVRRNTVLPMMYMSDALRAAVEIMEADRERIRNPGGYNLGAVSFAAGELENAISKRVPGFRVNYAPDSRQEIADSWPASVDDSAARSDWGWSHAYDLEKMVDEMLARLRQKALAQQKGG